MLDLVALLVLALPLLALALRRWRRGRRAYVVVDGSNVMHWKTGAPDPACLREVITHLAAQNLVVTVIFDANVGYKLRGTYMDDAALARVLRLPAAHVQVAPRGTPADPMILAAARRLRARVVSDDRFRDWAEDYPEVTRPGLLWRGGFRRGRLWLDPAH
ncbi:NYN domain-containing protein [Pseudooceanicola aestuarii]|uniref:NYN domain-containing protein n=1 Tax=Pseudooceanicola aestuarii TaxID=2697319 RepID=UPI0013D26D5D|nr:hypothetical protein [Pseudooceanicola aestuarii]